MSVERIYSDQPCPDCGDLLTEHRLECGYTRCRPCQRKRGVKKYVSQPGAILEPRNAAEEIAFDRLIVERRFEAQLQRMAQGRWHLDGYLA